MGGFQGTGLPDLKMLQDKVETSISAVGPVATETTSGFNSVRLQVTGADPSAFCIIGKSGDQAEVTDGAVHVLAQIVDDLPGGASISPQNICGSVASVPSSSTVMPSTKFLHLILQRCGIIHEVATIF